MGAKHKYYMVVDETAFDPSLGAEKHKLAGRFIHEASSHFNVIFATSTPDVPEASDRARDLGVFEFCDPEDITLCPWPLIRDRNAHVFISNRTSSTDTVKALTAHMGTITWSPFATFMKLYGDIIDKKIDKNSVAEVFEEKPEDELAKLNQQGEQIAGDLLQVYEEPFALWDKARAMQPVQTLLAEFNAHARRSRALERGLFLYFSETALVMDWESAHTANALQEIGGAIDNKAAESRCRELLPAALLAIDTAILFEPRKLVYFPE